MSTKKQINKNLELSEKLLDYLAQNPQRGKQDGVSYIVITQKDNELNKFNLSMVDALIKEGKKVIKAIETKDKDKPWKFTSIAS